jgi:prefoldin subunit 5
MTARIRQTSLRRKYGESLQARVRRLEKELERAEQQIAHLTELLRQCEDECRGYSI